MKIPLAWLQLSHEKIRLFLAIAGIGFADILMFMQLGFKDALFDSAITLHKRIDGEVFLISPQFTSLISISNFSERRLYQTLGIKGVKNVSPIYLDLALLKNPVNSQTRRIFVLGFNPADNVINLEGVQQNLDTIKMQDTVLFDQRSRKEFGPIPALFNEKKQVITELNRHKINIAGLFTMGTSFGADGNIMTSDTNFFRIFQSREPGLINIGVIRLEKDANLDEVLARIKQEVEPFDDVLVFSKAEFLSHEQSYWQNRTPIGFIFTLGAGMGFIVGMVIVYLILYTDVSDHLPEYATLKAMGYTDFYLLTIVFQESIMLSFVGYFPSLILAKFMYFMAANATGLPIIMTFSRSIFVLIMTLIMCIISGAIAVAKLSAADPADIF